MIKIQFPEPSFRIRQDDDKDYIFDSLRKKWIQLTDEEWVRQNFIQYMVQVKKYPATLIAIEKEIQLYDLKKRFDILVYDKQHQPWMMIECKAPDCKMDESVLQQVLRYSIAVPVKYILITNGEATFGWKRDDAGLHLINDLPAAQ